jgi:hypothetical protein
MTEGSGPVSRSPASGVRYLGMTRETSTPSFASRGGTEAANSASGPDFENGGISE